MPETFLLQLLEKIESGKANPLILFLAVLGIMFWVLSFVANLRKSKYDVIKSLSDANLSNANASDKYISSAISTYKQFQEAITENSALRKQMQEERKEHELEREKWNLERDILQKTFESERRELSLKMDVLSKNYNDVKIHIIALCVQMEKLEIKPVSLEEAIQKDKEDREKARRDIITGDLKKRKE